MTESTGTLIHYHSQEPEWNLLLTKKLGIYLVVAPAALLLAEKLKLLEQIITSKFQESTKLYSMLGLVTTHQMVTTSLETTAFLLQEKLCLQ